VKTPAIKGGNMSDKKFCFNCKKEITPENKGCWIDYQGYKEWFCNDWACQEEAEACINEEEDFHFSEYFGFNNDDDCYD